MVTVVTGVYALWVDNCHDMGNLWPVYRASTNQPKTAWARHLDQVMRDRDWSRVRLFEEVGAELGYRGKSRSAMLPLLVDKDPDEAKAAVLRRHFGDPPEAPAEVPAAEPDLAALIKLQTAAIDRQTAMLRAVLEAIAGPALDPDRQAWAQARLAEAIQSPDPTPDHNGERVR